MKLTQFCLLQEGTEIRVTVNLIFCLGGCKYIHINLNLVNDLIKQMNSIVSDFHKSNASLQKILSKSNILLKTQPVNIWMIYNSNTICIAIMIEVRCDSWSWRNASPHHCVWLNALEMSIMTMHCDSKTHKKQTFLAHIILK